MDSSGDSPGRREEVVRRLAEGADLRVLQYCGAVMGPGVAGLSVVDDGRGSLRRDRALTAAAAATLMSRRNGGVVIGSIAV